MRKVLIPGFSGRYVLRVLTAAWLALAMLMAAPLAQAQDTASRLPVNHLFVTLSDAMGAAKKGDAPAAAAELLRLREDFNRLDARNSEKGQVLSQRLEEAITQPAPPQLAALSSALLAFEQEQNPVDYTTKRAEFKRRITPALQQLAQSIAGAGPGDAPALRAAYQRFNGVWLGSERVVRNTSMGHYGAIETALALMRVAIETEPLNLEKMRHQAGQLQQAIDSYHSGQAMAGSQEKFTLADGVRLLREGLSDFEAGRLPKGQDKLTRFIEIWPVIEGEVSTRAPDLYRRVESQVPVVLAHAAQPAQQQQLQALIDELAQIDPQARYTAIDAMLILLREGLEALLIVMALVSALNVARQDAGKKWIYGGVLAGLVASVLGAVALQRLFPVATAGSNREMIEGVVGVFTVLMMLMVGAWLHSKSSLQAWNRYIQRHMGRALTAGSLVSLFGLSFLSVFREGAETILFYAGILPKISAQDFLSGILMAVALLALIAVVLFRTSYRLPIARMFKVLTWVIYALGFKILGVSLHALQLTGHLRMTSLQAPWLESPALGLYPTRETLLAQAVYIVVIVAIQVVISRSHTHHPAGAASRPQQKPVA